MQQTEPRICSICGHLLTDGTCYYTDETGKELGCEWCITYHFI